MGWIYVAKNMAKLGLPFLQDAVRQAPQDAAFRFHLGYALLQLHKPQEAADNFSQALAIDPSFSEADKAKELLAAARRQIRGS
jgi:thioredoxin-like negative regulator of GroEL